MGRNSQPDADGFYQNVSMNRVFETAHPLASSEPRASGITVRVPYDAKIFVNGQEMKGRGYIRRFSSEPLVNGKVYKYEVRAEVMQDGEKISKTELVQLQPGKLTNIDMDLSAVQLTSAKKESNETTLRIHVPMDASVYLDGEDTISVGKVRDFTTTDLKSGQVFKEFEVKVEVERDGKTITKVRKVNLRGGETQDVRFDLPETLAFSSFK